MNQKGFASILAVLIIVGALAIGAASYMAVTKLRTQTLPEVTPSDRITQQDFYSCAQDADCLLVQSEYCQNVIAINKNRESEWRQEDQAHTKIAKQNRQTCPVTLREYLDIQNFTPACENLRCIARFTGKAKTPEEKS